MARFQSIETRLKKRAVQNERNGHKAGYADEALDLMVAGFSVADLAENYGVSPSALYHSMAKAALMRIMIAHQKERIEELDSAVAEAEKKLAPAPRGINELARDIADNIACGTQLREISDLGPTRDIVVLNVVRGLIAFRDGFWPPHGEEDARALAPAKMPATGGQ